TNPTRASPRWAIIPSLARAGKLTPAANQRWVSGRTWQRGGNKDDQRGSASGSRAQFGAGQTVARQQRHTGNLAVIGCRENYYEACSFITLLVAVSPVGSPNNWWYSSIPRMLIA